MNIVWGFMPFILFVGLARYTSLEVARWAAFGIALVSLARDLGHGRRPKILEAGNAILFGGLIGWTMLEGIAVESLGRQRLIVDLGLFVIVIFSIVIGRPFTLQYARERTPVEIQGTPAFLRTNRLISGAWALVFLVQAGLDLALDRGLVPFQAFIPLALAVLAAGFGFTIWYPIRVRKARKG